MTTLPTYVPDSQRLGAELSETGWSHPVSPLFFFHPSTTNREKMKIAVLTSGGDSAGMNAVVRGVVRAGIVKFAASFPELQPSVPLYLSTRLFIRHPSSEDARHGSFVRGMKVSSAEMTKTCIYLRTIIFRYPRM